MAEIITLDNPDRAQVKTEWIGDRLRITWHKDQEFLHAITLSPEDAGLLSAVIQVALIERIVGIPTAEVST